MIFVSVPRYASWLKNKNDNPVTVAAVSSVAKTVEGHPKLSANKAVFCHFSDPSLPKNFGHNYTLLFPCTFPLVRPFWYTLTKPLHDNEPLMNAPMIAI